MHLRLFQFQVFDLMVPKRVKHAILTNIVIIPIERSTFNEIPCARTDHGEAPAKETINNPSPKPNKV